MPHAWVSWMCSTHLSGDPVITARIWVSCSAELVGASRSVTDNRRVSGSTSG
jgi:hypothetical protein